MKPLLIFDGDCGFCRKWIERWRNKCCGAVEFSPYQAVQNSYPEIPAEEFKKAVQLITPDGARLAGAAAIFKMLTYSGGRSGLDWMYRNLPGFSWFAEMCYSIVASNRMFFSKLMGSDRPDKNYRVSTVLFLRGLGLIYTMAFFSLAVQVRSLIGSKGILPAGQLLDAIYIRYGSASFFVLPSWFWIHISDHALVAGCWIGALAGLCIFLKRWMVPALILAWSLYLSYLNIALDFMSFQWDILLLEAGFLAIFLAPWRLKPFKASDFQPRRLIHFLLVLLLFRVMFFSGWVKLASGDAVWRHLTALTFHYETQPLPTWSSRFMHHLPLVFHQVSAALMFVAELFIPFLLFIPNAWVKRFAAFCLMSFQFLIFLTGNYTFFNLLTALLALLAVDDAFWQKKNLSDAKKKNPLCGLDRPAATVRNWPLGIVLLVFCLCFSLTVTKEGTRLGLKRGQGSWSAVLSQYHLVSSYGLFAVMTTTRPEILIEGSTDGHNWQPYLFRYKPVNLNQRPKQIAPHQPRLDWQMWFAALSDLTQNRWFLPFCQRLLEGSAPVLDLLDPNSPFRDRPPTFIRARLFEYKFTSSVENAANGDFWKRRELRTYLQPISLRRV